MKVCKKILSAVLVLLILISGLTIIPVGAADWTTMPNTTMELTATCDYSSAFEVLDYLNAYRVKKGLEELVMDEELLECAMQRAAELTVNFGHTRPDGSSWIKMHDNLWAENAAMNQVGAYYVVEDWKSSSGHNYNMLLDNVTAVGIGAVVHNGIPCWIQLFATEGEAMDYIPENTEKKFYIELGERTYSVEMATPDEMVVGETYRFQVHSPGEISGRYYYIIDNDCLEWTSSNPEVATVENGLVTAVGSGKTTITTKGCVEITETICVRNFSEGATNKCGDNITWSFSDGVLTLSGYGEMYDYYTEYTYHNNKISSTTVPYYDSFFKVKKVVVEEGVTALGDYAFAHFKTLEDIELPSTLTGIGDYTFMGAALYNNLVIPETVVEVGEYAFSGCKAEQIDFRCNVSEIPARAFYQCYNLTTVLMPENINRINERAFYACNSLKEITLPYGVERVDTMAFVGCDDLEKIIILNPMLRYWEHNKCATVYCYKNSAAEETSIVQKYNYKYLDAEEIKATAEGYTVTYTGNVVDDEIKLNIESTKDEYIIRYSFGEEFNYYRNFESIEALFSYYREELADEDMFVNAGTYPISYLVYTDGYIPAKGTVNIIVEKIEYDFNFENDIFRVPYRQTYLPGLKNPVVSIKGITEDQIFYRSSDENIAEITLINGSIIPRGIGTCIISAYVDDKNNYDGPTKTYTLTTYRYGNWRIDGNSYYFYDDGTVSLTRYVGNDETLEIPERIFDCKIIKLEKYAVRCSELTTLTLPDTITEIGEAAFVDSKNLSEIYFKGTREQWENIEIHENNDEIWNANIYDADGNLIYAPIIETEPTTSTEATEVTDTAESTLSTDPVETSISTENSEPTEMVIPSIVTEPMEEDSTPSEDNRNHDEKITVYFTNTLNWSRVLIYYSSDCTYCEYPGDLMKYTFTNQYGQDVYKFDIPACTTGLNFTEGDDCDQTRWIADGVENNAGFYVDVGGEKEYTDLYTIWSYGTWTYDPENIVTGTQATTSVESESNVANSSVCTDPTEEIVTDVSEVITDPTETNTDSSETVTDPTHNETAVVTDPIETPIESSVSESEIVSTESTTTENVVNTEVTTTNTTESNSSVSESSIFENSTITNTAPTTNVEVVEYLAGDVNQDGKVNIKDATLIQKHIAKLTQLDDVASACADVTADKKINIKDATMIQKYVAKLIETFPAGKTIKIS